MSKKNIQEVVNSDLCTGCGSCQGVCPAKAITFKWKAGTDCFHGEGIQVPKVNNNCNMCGLCYEVCPGYGINYDALNVEFFGNPSKDLFLGNYLKIWVGHSADESLRYKATSGGIITSLLIFALEERIIDAAILLGMDEDNPLLTKAFVARTPEEVVAGIGSKYTSGPVNSLISEIMKNEGKYAVVGLPCHIEGLRKAELQIKKLRQSIVLHFGLFCSTKVSYTGLKFWLQVNKIKPQDVSELSYRGNGWPGEMSIKLKNGKSLAYPLPYYWRFVENFAPIRCTLCTDGLAEFADISFGDAWLEEFSKDKKGTSIFVVRSQKGAEIVDLAVSKNKLVITEATSEMLFNSQNKMLEFKKKGFQHRAKMLSRLGKKVPNYTGGFEQSGLSSLLEPMIFYSRRWIFRKKTLWPLIYKWNIKVQPRLAKTWRTTAHFAKLPILKMIKYMSRVTSVVGYFSLRYLIVPKTNFPQTAKNVLIINQADLLNKGDAAILSGTMKIVHHAFPNAEVVVVSHTPDVDTPRCSAKVVPSFQFLSVGNNFQSVVKTAQLLVFSALYQLTGSCRVFRFPLLNRIANETLVNYAKADLVIHRGGDNLTEDYGIPYLYFESLIIGILLRKPTIILGESIGPFAAKESQYLAKATLSSMTAIITREETSVNNLWNLSISKPKIYTFPDVAFVLQPSSKERLQFLLHSENLEKLKKPVFAISASALIARYGFSKVPEDQKVNHLIAAFANLIKYYQEKLGASFVFVPHVIGEGNDDRVISREIVATLANHDNIHIIQGDYSHEDFRAFISESVDIFIGARMHANIAAVSVGVPTLALAYGQKTFGILGGMLGYSDFIVDVRQVPNGDALFQEMTSKIDLLWSRRDTVKKDLAEKMIKIKKDAWKSVTVLTQYVNNKTLK